MEFPADRLSSNDSLDDEGCCYICLEDFSDGEEVCQSHNCKHKFHMKGCMNEWLVGHDECPVCRRDYTQCVRQHCKQHDNDRIAYVDPVLDVPHHVGAVLGIHQTTRYNDERWRFREAGLTAMSEFPPWFW
jgi:Ring finger domain